MKKIGIVTWFGGPNYGTILQAIALQKKIKSLGVNSELVNFIPPDIPQKKRTLKSKVKGFIPGKIYRLKEKIIFNKYGEAIACRDNKMRNIVLDKCIFSPAITDETQYIEICKSYDLMIFGSDQIWNPNWFHPFYYADYAEIGTPRIAYAPSIGVCEIQESMIDKYKKVLYRFSCIAVREDIGVKLINKITGKDIKKVVDPTLLLNADEWNNLFKIKNSREDYVLLYLLKDNKNHIKAALEFAKEKSLKLKIIPYQNDTYFIRGDIVADAGPKEFLEYIKNAKYIVTDSFHGMIFSIIYKKEFYVLTRFDDRNQESQNSRVYQIINEYGLQERLQKFNTTVIEESEKIDYDLVYKILGKQIHFSMQYLQESLEGVIAYE